MSADNQVTGLHFKTKEGKTLWRVFESTLSGFPLENCLVMSTKATRRDFKDFEGKDAYAKAYAFALRFARSLPVCEYGVHLSPPEDIPVTFEDLKRQASSAGYDVTDLFEADDFHLKALPKNYILKIP